MAMRKSAGSCAMSMKRVSLMLGLVLILLVSTQMSGVHCRALRSLPSETGNLVAAGCQQAQGGESPSVGRAAVSSFAVSSNNSSSQSSSSVRSLMFTLASGPSKRGPGH